MVSYQFKTDLIDVDWHSLKSELNKDSFDNGRTAEQLRDSFENSTYTVLVLDQDRLIATAWVLSDRICNAYLVDVWTHSDYRNQGIATKMLSILEDNLQGQHLYLQTDDKIEFYKHLGFTEQPVGMSKIIGTWLKN